MAIFLTLLISPTPKLQKNNTPFTKYSKTLKFILTALTFFYTKHVLIKQNKNSYVHINTIPSIKTVMLGL